MPADRVDGRLVSPSWVPALIVQCIQRVNKGKSPGGRSILVADMLMRYFVHCNQTSESWKTIYVHFFAKTRSSHSLDECRGISFLEVMHKAYCAGLARMLRNRLHGGTCTSTGGMQYNRVVEFGHKESLSIEHIVGTLQHIMYKPLEWLTECQSG